MTTHEELFTLSEKWKAAAATGEGGKIGDLLAALEDAAHAVGRSFSGSWQCYHSRVYYADLSPPPLGAHFSQKN